MNKEKQCQLCSTITPNRFNINFNAVHVCEDCARTIFLQQARWYADQEAKPAYMVDISKLPEDICITKLSSDPDMLEKYGVRIHKAQELGDKYVAGSDPV